MPAVGLAARGRQAATVVKVYRADGAVMLSVTVKKVRLQESRADRVAKVVQLERVAQVALVVSLVQSGFLRTMHQHPVALGWSKKAAVGERLVRLV
ncbi:hypothetical protein GCM10011495_06580 [Hymenobacter frigidus]|uniref:Uncharacterized protein n=1 Tax=Hymenobacter frigidus TaxID=1524095 RepID=A0ABQ1ZYZ2_9BACT|nr:hypothetical protein GCM10011495_06580 [Hymenobacter frigidus]